jgi:hypothetical protein
MNLTKAMKISKTHIAEPDRMTLCGKPSTPLKYVSADQARILRDGSRHRLCGQCDKALAATEARKEVD